MQRSATSAEWTASDRQLLNWWRQLRWPITPHSPPPSQSRAFIEAWQQLHIWSQRRIDPATPPRSLPRFAPSPNLEALQALCLFWVCAAHLTAEDFRHRRLALLHSLNIEPCDQAINPLSVSLQIAIAGRCLSAHAVGSDQSLALDRGPQPDHLDLRWCAGNGVAAGLTPLIDALYQERSESEQGDYRRLQTACQFVNAAECGQLGLVTQLSDQFPSLGLGIDGARHLLLQACAMLQGALRSDCPLEEPALHTLETAADDLPLSPRQQLLDAIQILRSNQAASASMLTERRLEDLLINSTREPSIIAFSGLRLAARAGDHLLLKRLLEHRRSWGLSHWPDRLYDACCLAMQEGDSAEIAQLLRLGIRGAAAQSASGRWDFEFRAQHTLSLARSHLILGQHPTNPPSAEPIPVIQSSNKESQWVGNSTYSQQLRHTFDQAARWPGPLLILGESGVGKEVAARLIHQLSRAQQPFVALNCAGLSEGLLESELFGHSKGAFTGAERERRGLIASAGQGTLFLDEIGDADPRFQALLLRLLEGGDYRPVGSDRASRIEARIIAATNVDLHQEMLQHRFRNDLWYRLQGFTIDIRPLRERPDDLVDLATHFAQQLRPSARLSNDLQALLTHHPWPGNARELRSAVQRMVFAEPETPLYSARHWTLLPIGPQSSPVAHALPSTSPRSPHPTSPNLFAGDTSPRSQRLLVLRDLFKQHHRLTRKAVMNQLSCSQRTATLYLKELISEGFITRIEPSRAPASHYFQYVDGDIGE